MVLAQSCSLTLRDESIGGALYSVLLQPAPSTRTRTAVMFLFMALPSMALKRRIPAARSARCGKIPTRQRRSAPSLRLDPGVLDDLAPLGEVVALSGGQVLGRAADGFG